jgi:uncharacterized membrane protein YphA (DoxX/SURF4 family)
LDVLAVCVRFVLAAVFLLAGWAKLLRLTAFEDSVRAYRLLPNRLVRPVARLLPAIEILLGATLLLGVGLRPASVAVAVLLALFTAAIVWALMRRRDIACGCFGTSGPERIGPRLVIRNMLLLAAALVLASQAPTGLAVDGVLAGESAPPSEDALAIAIGTAAAVLALQLGTATFRVLLSLKKLTALERLPQ